MKIMTWLKVIFLFLLVNDLSGQKKYWVKNDDVSAHKILDSLHSVPEFCSKWAQSCSYNLTDIAFELIVNKTTISPVLSFAPHSYGNLDAEQLGFALDQIGARLLIEKGLTGEGIKIGIIDGGFLNANQNESLSYFFKNNKIEYYKDFVTPNLKQYGGIVGLDDNHGTEVWQLIGGNDSKKNIQFGLATKSTYYLARTDHGGYEKRIEEDFMLKAMEEMADQGVRLFNISLGYTHGYNDKKENYKVSDIDGKTSVLTRALDRAADKMGILFVVAAGNDGSQKWKTLSIPADAKNVLTVGASKFKVWDKMNYSSIGPETLDYLKPNISVYSTTGTSYSAPIITGLAACMMQYDTTLSNYQIISMLEKASNFYPFGNNYVGFGVPKCEIIMDLLQGIESKNDKSQSIHTSRESIKIKGSIKERSVVIYHKKDDKCVLYREFRKPKKNWLMVKKPKEAKRSTLLIEQEIIEIFWDQ